MMDNWILTSCSIATKSAPTRSMQFLGLVVGPALTCNENVSGIVAIIHSYSGAVLVCVSVASLRTLHVAQVCVSFQPGPLLRLIGFHNLICIVFLCLQGLYRSYRLMLLFRRSLGRRLRVFQRSFKLIIRL